MDCTDFRFCGLKGFGDVFDLDQDDRGIPCENVEWEEN